MSTIHNTQSIVTTNYLVADSSEIPLLEQSKNQTPLDKEVKKYNKTLRAIFELQEKAKQKSKNELEYHKIYTQEITPLVSKIADAEVQFLKPLFRLVQEYNLSNSQKQQFIQVAMDMLLPFKGYLEAVDDFISQLVALNYSLLSNKEKKALIHDLERSGINTDDIDLDDFDVDAFKEKLHASEHEEAEEQHRENNFKTSNAQKNNKDNTPLDLLLKKIYKELAKLFHPDAQGNKLNQNTLEYYFKTLSIAYKEKNLYTMLKLKLEYQKQTNEELDSNYSLEELKTINKLLGNNLNALKETLSESNPEFYLSQPQRTKQQALHNLSRYQQYFKFVKKRRVYSVISKKELLEFINVNSIY